jgi:hypothetical protein
MFCEGDVKVYPYKSFVSEPFLTLDAALVRKLQEALAEAAGTHPDNHVVYEVRGMLGGVYIGFTDNRAHFSHKLGSHQPASQPRRRFAGQERKLS